MKSRLLLVAIAAAALSTASLASAEDAAPAAGATTAATTTTVTPKSPSARDPNEVVCKTVEVIGTRLGGGRICKTRAEWAQTRRDAHDAVDDAQRNAGTANPKGG